ncbi:hypothetical protein SCLARK_001696 [Spiroplasma clarkii]|uniref:Uncharacterized protein n=1 Tax=Spiroplasma clarkii TaxID=2139 RepID=A0A1Y0L368_9MOLU|nr:hypothetical protein [Spiroplasma clarkii]ARU92158.1 hypothetical protein SCLARK_001696 [Spiroplasma clarkii]ATX71490.1 hypothetical protein SCLAR_v1c11900 [Spiroplasma clarkii]
MLDCFSWKYWTEKEIDRKLVTCVPINKFYFVIFDAFFGLAALISGILLFIYEKDYNAIIVLPVLSLLCFIFITVVSVMFVNNMKILIKNLSNKVKLEKGRKIVKIFAYIPLLNVFVVLFFYLTVKEQLVKEKYRFIRKKSVISVLSSDSIDGPWWPGDDW